MRILIAILVMCASAAAQAKPDFSGTWTAETAQGAIYGAQFIIEHSGQALMLQRPYVGSTLTVNYLLDGSEINNRMPGRLCQPDTGGQWTAKWEGNDVSILMTNAIPPNGKPIKMNVQTRLKMESPDALVVEVTSQPANQPPRTTTTRYKKSGPPRKAEAPAMTKAKATISQVDWIAGVWQGNTAEERWTPGAGGAMIGVSRTVRDGIQTEFEFLCIVERDGGLVYQAMPNGQQPPTDFTLTKVDAESATFENPQHDFPKMIRYVKKPDGVLEATISGAANQRPITFTFKKQN